MKWQVAGVFLVVGFCLAEIELPAHPQNLDDVPQIKERCQAKGKPDTYDRLKVAMNETKTCLQSKINPEKIKEELDAAKKTGSMDEVFGKYCKKRQEYKSCIMSTVNITKECMEEAEISALDKAITVIEEVVDFACYKNGDRLAMFVAEGGPECLSSRTEQIKNCINGTLKIDPSSFSVTSLPTSLPSLKIDKKKCDDLNEIRNCIVEDLEKNCQDTTPANIMDALFKFIKKTTCKNVKQRRSVNLLRLKRSLPAHAMNYVDVSKYSQQFIERCKKYGGEEVAQELVDTMQKAKYCMTNKTISATSKDEYLRDFTDCTKDGIEKIKNCLPDEMKWYPDFIIYLIRGLLKFVYENLDILKMNPQSDLVHCMQRIKATKALKRNEPICSQRFRQNQTDISNLNKELPDKETFCKILTESDECINEFIKNTCPPDVAVNRALKSLSKAIQTPCRTNYDN